MPIDLPSAVSQRLAAFEAGGEPLTPIPLASELDAAAAPIEGLSESQRRGCLAEIASLRFLPAHPPGMEPWGIYFQPLGSFVDASGETHHGPDARWMDREIIDYWKARSATCQHAALRARYADLAREIGGLWNSDHPSEPKIERPRGLAQLAAASYIEAVENDLSKDTYASWQWLERALELAATVKDAPLIERAKKAAFDFQRARDRAGDSGLWWRLDDIMAGAKTVVWTHQERTEIADLLRRRLRLASDINGSEFDPHAATGAADRVARWVDANEKASALRTAGAAFEAIAAKADPLVATAWLEDLSRRYREANMPADANRVDIAIRDRSSDVQALMKTASTSIEITPEEMNHWLDEVVQGSLEIALARVAVANMVDPKQLEQEIQDMAAQAPIQAMTNISILGPNGFTTAIVGPIAKDMPGRLIHRLADTIAMSSPFLHQALERAKANYSLDADAWLGHFASSPLFPPDRHAMLKMGIDAWISGDTAKAVHVLVPQVEAALRESLISMGESPMRPAKTSGGFEAIGMGAILNHPTFKVRIPPTMRLHLTALYVDPRGINLRNKLAHGHASGNLLGLAIANWVIHSLVTIRAFGFASSSSPQAKANP
jgi:hypothetical protein